MACLVGALVVSGPGVNSSGSRPGTSFDGLLTLTPSAGEQLAAAVTHTLRYCTQRRVTLPVRAALLARAAKREADLANMMVSMVGFFVCGFVRV